MCFSATQFGYFAFLPSRSRLTSRRALLEPFPLTTQQRYTHPSTFACSKFPRTRFLAELLILQSTVACCGLARAKFKTPFATVSITDEVTPIALRDDTPEVLLLLVRRCCCCGVYGSAICLKAPAEGRGVRGIRKPVTPSGRSSIQTVPDTMVKIKE